MSAQLGWNQPSGEFLNFFIPRKSRKFREHSRTPIVSCTHAVRDFLASVEGDDSDPGLATQRDSFPTATGKRYSRNSVGGISSQKEGPGPPPVHFRVAYLAPASGTWRPSVSSGGGPSCIFDASGGESAFPVDLESTYAVEVDSCFVFVVLSCDFTGKNNGQLTVLPTLPRFHKRISAKTCICAGLDALALLRPHSANRLERTNASCAAHCTAWRRSVLHLGACELPEALDRRRALAGSDTFCESNYKSLSLSRSWTETVAS